MSRAHVAKVAEAYMSGGPFPLAEDAVFTFEDSGEVFEGRDAIWQMLTAWYSEMFDADSERLAVFVGDDAFAVEFSFEGTHIGDFHGIGATGRTVSFPFVGIYQVEGSEIVAGRTYLPMERIKSMLSSGARGELRSSPPTAGRYERARIRERTSSGMTESGSR